MQKENYVLVVMEQAVEGKTKIIESILDKLVAKATMVAVPSDGRHSESPVVRDWCAKNDIIFSTIERDDDGNFTEWCSFGVFFVSGPTRGAFADFYRQALHWEGKLSVVIEVNSESKDEIRSRRNS